MSKIIECEKIIYKNDNFLEPFPVLKVYKNINKDMPNIIKIKLIKDNILNIKIKKLKKLKINIIENTNKTSKNSINNDDKGILK